MLLATGWNSNKLMLYFRISSDFVPLSLYSITNNDNTFPIKGIATLDNGFLMLSGYGSLTLLFKFNSTYDLEYNLKWQF